MGGIAGGTLGLFAGLHKYDHEHDASKKASIWKKIKSCPWSYVVIPAVIGAALGGSISYFFTPEQYLNKAENELNILESGIGSFTSISQIKDYFNTVIKSGIKPLVAIAEQGLARVEAIEQKISAEKYLNLAQDYLYSLENNAVFKLAMDAENANEIKNRFFDVRLPTVYTYKKLDSLVL